MVNEFIAYNGEEFFTCKKCNCTKDQSIFRKLKGGKVCTVCRSCTNIEYKANPMKSHLNAVRCRAKRDGVLFNLTLEDLEIPTLCPALGITLNSKWGSEGRTNTRDNTPSIDRIVPSLGYVKGNTRVISHRANRIKTDATREELLMVYKWLDTEISANLTQPAVELEEIK